MPLRMKALHAWNVDTRAAVDIQRRLAGDVILRSPWKRLPSRMRVAAADVSCPRGSKRIVAAAVVVELPGGAPLEVVRVERTATFPYVPGYLSFREAPVCLEALTRLACDVDAIVCDGQGLAHPRGLGLACHVGLFAGVPTVGCAKSRLCGGHEDVGREKGDAVPLVLGGRTVGTVVRSRTDTKPLYVSPGHLMSVAQSVRLVMACVTKYRLPDPARMAHQAAGWRGAEGELLDHLRARHARC
jgi:deoxyribonuclease V